eukprot:327198-Rhodomonas_salina.1
MHRPDYTFTLVPTEQISWMLEPPIVRRDAARKNRHSSEDCSVLRVTADISFSRMSSTISQTESAIGGAFSRLQSTISTEGSSVRKFSRIPSSQTEGASGGFFLRRQSTMSTESCSAGKFSRTPSAVSTESFGFVRTKSKCSRVPSTNASADSCGFTRTKSKFSRAPSTESFGFARTRSYSDHDLRIPEFSSTSLETRAESTSTTASFARSFSTVLTLDSAANDDNFRISYLDEACALSTPFRSSAPRSSPDRSRFLLPEAPAVKKTGLCRRLHAGLARLPFAAVEPTRPAPGYVEPAEYAGNAPPIVLRLCNVVPGIDVKVISVASEETIGQGLPD